MCSSGLLRGVKIAAPTTDQQTPRDIATPQMIIAAASTTGIVIITAMEVDTV